ncbi:MAG: glycosyltransferase family 2 protein, partial [Blastococcus sp.]|nr:glycosyltransferase family 2 protein [Blastococcus sp.]
MSYDIDDRDWVVPQGDQHVLAERGSRYCVLIPVINEGQRILDQLKRLQELDLGIDVLVADGGSTDGSNDPGV